MYKSLESNHFWERYSYLNLHAWIWLYWTDCITFLFLMVEPSKLRIFARNQMEQKSNSMNLTLERKITQFRYSYNEKWMKQVDSNVQTKAVVSEFCFYKLRGQNSMFSYETNWVLFLTHQSLIRKILDKNKLI